MSPRLERLVGVSRGVRDPEQVASFYAWLFDTEVEAIDAGFRLGGLVLRAGDPRVEIVWQGPPDAGACTDPDGVVSRFDNAADASSRFTLDHVRLNCADLEQTCRYYLGLGLVTTWAGKDSETLADGDQSDLVAGADWVHLSARDGYLSVSQADWQDYGVHNPATGPPRFIHLGFAVRDLDATLRKLDDAGVETMRIAGPVGRQVYLNDPDGVPQLGQNIELIEYASGVRRSGARA